MKTKFMKMGGLMIAMALLGAFSMQSCQKSGGEGTPTPADVENPLTQSVYYVTGVVTTSDGSPVSGVTVATSSTSTTTSSDGTYSLTFILPYKTYVNFSKDGYVSVVATATFESNAKAGSTVILSQEMAKQVEAQAVAAEASAELTFTQASSSNEGDGSDAVVIAISIPQGAVSTATEISATVFTPAQEESVAVAVTSAIESLDDAATTEVPVSTSSTFVALDLQPDGTEFTTPITVSIPVASTSTYFTDVDHVKYNESTGTWDYEGDATFNSGAYDIKVSGFSQHGVQTSSDVTISKSSEEIITKEYNNIGKTSAISSTLTYSQTSGWVIDTDESDTESDLYSEMVQYVTNFMGTSAGTTTISASKAVAVSGDEKLTVEVTQSVVTYEFSFATSGGTKIVTVDSYGSVSIETETVQGDLRTDHNY